MGKGRDKSAISKASRTLQPEGPPRSHEYNLAAEHTAKEVVFLTSTTPQTNYASEIGDWAWDSTPARAASRGTGSIKAFHMASRDASASLQKTHQLLCSTSSVTYGVPALANPSVWAALSTFQRSTGRTWAASGWKVRACCTSRSQ